MTTTIDNNKRMRQVEMYRLWLDNTWDTEYYDIPADTPEDDIERVASLIALQQIEEPCAGVGVYSYDNDDDDEDEDEDEWEGADEWDDEEDYNDDND